MRTTARIATATFVTRLGLGLATLALFATAPPSVAQTVPVQVRVQGLALGNTVALRQGGATVTATVDEQIAVGQGNVGSPLQIDVVTQPDGQTCALSDFAPTTVPAAGTPVFVRCVHAIAPRITMPDTLPNDALAWWQDGASLRTIAYPGIPYESRATMTGGIFPYEYRLLGARFNGQPFAGAVSLDFRRGTLRFTPPSAGSYAFDIEVRDSGSAQKVTQRTFTITVATDRFLFVAPTGIDTAGRGSIAQPFRTIAFALAQGTTAQALMVRKGVYPGRFDFFDNRVVQVLAYPDEVPVIDLTGAGSIDVKMTQAPTARFEGFDITGVRQYGIVSDPSLFGVVLRHLRFLDGVVANGGENPAYIHGWGSFDPRHRFLVQDSAFLNYPDGYAATWFDATDSVFENNVVRLGSTHAGVHDKDNSQHNVYRENLIEYAPEFANNQGIQISAQVRSLNIHIHHNLLINTGVWLGGQCLTEDCVMLNHDVHHNTVINASMVMRWGVFDPPSGGTRFSHNVVRGAVAPYAWFSCLGTLPTAFATQIQARANRLETSNPLAMYDDQCGGSPMNIPWSQWRGTHGHDTVASGSVLSATTDMIGTGPQTRLPVGDPRLTTLGHRYPLPVSVSGTYFSHGFELP